MSPQDIFTSDNNKPAEEAPSRSDDEHETHASAVILLLLATLVLIGVINTERSQIDQPTAPATSQTAVDQESHGAGIPVADVATAKQKGLSGLPDTLSIPESARIVQNYSSDLGEHQQRVAVVQTSRDVDKLVSRYQSWVEDNGFTLDRTNNQQESGAITASKSSDQLTIAVVDNGQGSRVQFNYVTGR